MCRLDKIIDKIYRYVDKKIVSVCYKAKLNKFIVDSSI